MTQEQIREVLNNFNNLKWDNENYANFVAHVRALNIETLDEDFKQKVITFLKDAEIPKNFDEPKLQDIPVSWNEDVNNVEKQALGSSEASPFSPLQFNDKLLNNISVVDGLNLEENDQSLELNPISYETQQSSIKENSVYGQKNNYSNSSVNEKNNLQKFNTEEKKSKKKSNLAIVILLLLILIGAVVAGLFYADVIKFPFKIKKSNNIVDNNEKSKEKEELVCSLVENDINYNAQITTNITIIFDTNNIAKTIEYITTYEFSTFENFSKWKDEYIKNVNENTNQTIEFNDEDFIIKAIIITDVKDLSGNIPTDYTGIKNYFVNLGHTCNTHSNDSNNSEIPNTNEATDNIKEKYLVTDKIDTSNNLFTYKQLYFDEIENSSTTILGWVTDVVNKSAQGQLLNIYLKFYDQEENEIGEYMLIPKQEVSETSMFYMAPGANKNMSFNISSESLNEDKTIQDIKFFSIEDL